MYKKAYILVFDKDEIDANQLHSAIEAHQNNGSIYNWWHFIKTCYILISNKTADDLAKSIGNSIVSAKKFLLIEVNMNNRQGWLNEDAWKWINDNKGNTYSSF
jgi:hypothetical protein